MPISRELGSFPEALEALLRVVGVLRDVSNMDWAIEAWTYYERVDINYDRDGTHAPLEH